MARTASSSWRTPGARMHAVIVYQLPATARRIFAVMASSPPMPAQGSSAPAVTTAGRPPMREFVLVMPGPPGKPFAVHVTSRPPAGSCRIGSPQDTLMLVAVVDRVQGLRSWLVLRYVISAEKLDASFHERARHVAGYRNDRPYRVNRASFTGPGGRTGGPDLACLRVGNRIDRMIWATAC